MLCTDSFSILLLSMHTQTEAAYSAGVIGMIMMRTENSSSSGPPSSRIYYQDTDSISVSPVPVLGVTYAAGTLLKDYLDLSNTVRQGWFH